MIAFLRGILYEKQLSHIVLDVGGVGYEVMIPLSTYDTLPKVGSEYKCLIYEHIREDAHLLFGFSTESERDFFKLLITVSGVGPKIAIGALGGMTIAELRAAIVAKDSKRISKLPGIGKKMAERIVVELADKINPLEVFATDQPSGESSNQAMTQACHDAVLGLVQLGFNQDAAVKTVREIFESSSGDLSTGEIITKALAQR
ncbi:MAG: Holliday junction branch migration protein RuvA [Kiritimatiellae bacterium]|nr:Holliday junction branch migration protein RuvA [Kiritimatiellia bacterium]